MADRTDDDSTRLRIGAIEDLSAVVDATGPWVSAVVDVPLAGARGSDTGSVWSAPAAAARVGGAPEGLLRAVERVLTDPGVHGRCTAVVAGPEMVATCPLGPSDGRPSWAVFGSQPCLLPVLEVLADRTPAVGVLLDRAGADLHVYRADGDDDTTPVAGDTTHVHKGAPGGWSQRRFQTRAELTWERNAAEVAAELAAQVRAAGAVLVAVSGDERARGYLHDHLPADIRPLVHDVSAGGRNDPDAPARLHEAVRSLLAGAATAVRAGWLAELREGVALGDRAVTGTGAVFDALTTGRVRVLFVAALGATAPADHPFAYAGGPRGPWSASAEAVGSLGLEPVEGRRTDVAVAAAVATGAAVVTVGPGEDLPSPDGFGAVLRYRTEGL